MDSGSRSAVDGHLPQRLPRGWLFGPPAGETSTARSMRSGKVVATSTMIGQPSELPTNVARSTPDGVAVGHQRPRQAREVERSRRHHAPAHPRQVGHVRAVARGQEGGRRLEVRAGDAEPVDVDDRIGRRTSVGADAVEHGSPSTMTQPPSRGQGSRAGACTKPALDVASSPERRGTTARPSWTRFQATSMPTLSRRITTRSVAVAGSSTSVVNTNVTSTMTVLASATRRMTGWPPSPCAHGDDRP